MWLGASCTGSETDQSHMIVTRLQEKGVERRVEAVQDCSVLRNWGVEGSGGSLIYLVLRSLPLARKFHMVLTDSDLKRGQDPG